MSEVHAYFLGWAHRSPVRHLSMVYQRCHYKGAKERLHLLLAYLLFGTDVSPVH